MGIDITDGELELDDGELNAALDAIRREAEHLISSGLAHRPGSAESRRYRRLVELESRLIFERDQRARR